MARKPDNNLSHSEVWDDTDLQTIWNDSIAEYQACQYRSVDHTAISDPVFGVLSNLFQKYHSIHARGEDVREVLKLDLEAERGDSSSHIDADALAATAASGDGIDDAENHIIETSTGENGLEIESDEYIPAKSIIPDTAPNHSAETSNIPMPQAMIAQSSHDQGIKDLMMSWYWAGYYTGLYEGQQQGQTKQANASG